MSDSDEAQSVFEGSVAPPFLVLKGDALRNNLDEMRAFCERNDVVLAPHCKTHMSVELWRMQEESGAVAATVATVPQARVFFDAGVQRVLIANEVVDAASLRAISTMRAERPDFEISFLVDSVAGVEIATTVFGDANQSPVRVFIEMGAPGRRSGCRTVDEVVAVAEAVAASPALQLVGIEGYEGVFASVPAVERNAVVDDFLDSGVLALRALVDRGLVTTPAIATFGGSRHYPAVIERVRQHLSPEEVTVVIRSGCYLTHDHGTYADSHAQIPSSVGKPNLLPAMEVWGAVLSMPEPGLALVGIGKRDVSYDEGLPVVLERWREGELAPVDGATVQKLNDQHAFVSVAGASATELRVGDLVGFGISHPCTTFDKWRSALVVDAKYRVQTTVHTNFH